MPRRYIPQEPKADRIIYNNFSLKLAIRLGSTEQAIVINAIHQKLQTKAGKPTKYPDFYIQNRWWTADPYWKWRDELFPLSREETVRISYFKPLIEAGILIQSNFDNGLSRRSWFTLDYERLHELFPFTVQTYPNICKGYHDKQGNSDVTVTLPTINRESKPRLTGNRNHDKKGNDTTINGESLLYIYNNKDYITKDSTISSTKSSTISSTTETVDESVKRKGIKSDVTNDLESELNDFLNQYRTLTGEEYKDPDTIKELLYNGESVTDLIALEELAYGWS